MEYISVNEAAAKWGVCARIVQGHCKAGRISGAQKFGRSWMILAGAEKPDDPRRCPPVSPTPKEAADFPCKTPLLLLSRLYRVPGSGDAVVASLAQSPEAQVLFAAQLAYYRGELDRAYALLQPLLSSASCFESRVGAGIGLSSYAMLRGNATVWRRAKEYLAEIPCRSEGEREQLLFWQAAADSAINDNRCFPEAFCRGSLDLLPADSFPVGRFFYAKHLYVAFIHALQAREGDSQVRCEALLQTLMPVCELLISQTRAEGVLVAEIYLQLICAIAYHAAGSNALATVHIDRAIALALPDRLYSPLAEYRRPLDRLLDERLSAANPAAMQAVKALHKRLMEGWVALHNAVLNRRVSNDLTAREMEIFKLAAYGFSNEEIAKRLYISVSTVKQTLRSAMDKTGTESRFALAEFI